MPVESVGRYLPYSELYSSNSWPIADTTFCVASLAPRTASAKQRFFLSHRWSTLVEPDRDGTKLAALKRMFEQLLEMRQEFSALPVDVPPSEIAGLIERRHEAPLIPVEYLRRWQQWRDWDAPGAFRTWLLGSVIDTLEGEWWIDSFSLPNREHRASCDHCDRNFPFFLRRVPAAISESTCFFLPRDDDSFRRGWIQLEVYVASASDCLVQDIGVNTAHITQKLIRGDYQCAEHQDAWYLPRLYALNQVAMECRHIERQYAPIRTALYTPSIIDEIDDVMGTSQKGHQEPKFGFIGDLIRLLRHLVSDRFLGLCKQHGIFPQVIGGLLMKTAMYCVSACLLSECVKRGLTVPSDVDPQTAAFAALYECVCRQRMSVESAMWAIFRHWQFTTGVRIVKNLEVDRQRQERIEHIYEHLEKGAQFFILDGDFTSLIDGEPPVDRQALEELRSMVVFRSDSLPVLCSVLHVSYIEGAKPFAAEDDPSEPSDSAGDSRVRSDEGYERLFSPAGIPTIAAMTKVPRWGCVSFAARCARRVQPFISVYWPDAPQQHLQAVEECLLLGEGRSHQFQLRDSLIDRLTVAANETNELRRTSGDEVASRCRSAIGAALVTAYAIKAAFVGQKRAAADNASDAALQACRAVKPNYEIVEHIRADYRALHRRTRAAKWRDHWMTHVTPAWTFFSEPPAYVDYNGARPEPRNQST